MADSRLCSIPDCGKSHSREGYCKAHYARFLKYGDPLAGRTARGAARNFLLTDVMNYEGDECLVWPFSRDKKGYGRINIYGKPRVVSRVVCEKTHGPPLVETNEAAHSCGKGHLGCVTKRHLSWKTCAENNADKNANGTQNRGERCPQSKLTTEDVLEIRNKVGTVGQKELAIMFGVSRCTIRNIRDRETWFHLP
jgi:hypothetical protein